MSFQPPLTEEELETLAGRTIVITGGASGIGKAAILEAHRTTIPLCIRMGKKECRVLKIQQDTERMS
jgi:NAD(P)-dependent dehydrogenase (short-subunit alcohol dehydrogenase family)